MSELFSLKTKIIILFLIPSIALIYFSYDYMQRKSEFLQQTERFEFVSKQTKRLTQLIKNIQLERGLSAGYIVANSDNEKILHQQLIKQFQETDAIIDACQKSSSANQSVLAKILPAESINKIKPLNHAIFAILEDRNKIRKQILNKEIDFNDEILYYTEVNNHAINLMKFLLLILQKTSSDSISLLNIEKTKEFAGLERACIYNQLISHQNNQLCKEKVFYLQKEQKNELREFELFASSDSLHIFENNIDYTTLQKLQTLRDYFAKGETDAIKPQLWFNLATSYIDSLNNISNKILANYITKAHQRYDAAWKQLYIAIALWIVSIFATIYILILLSKLFEKEQEQLKALRIASYAFNSQEAIAITDIDEKIIKINKGFTDITGYSESEALGQTPRILRSSKHSKEFFEKMWDAIKTKGRWKGDIYNKRKNGEVYPERLSITAIKDDEGKTTNYIAHFLDISDLKKAQEEAEHQANHDILTGIANRKLLMEILQKELSKAKRHHLTHAFMFIDLDHFKAVNDNYGHHIGDMLIKYTAEVLLKSVRKEDFVARISGDEFAVLLLNLKAEDATEVAQKIAKKILHELSQELHFEGHTIHISSSIGIRIFPLSNDEDIEKIISDADTAMYQAKTQGKNRFILHT